MADAPHRLPPALWRAGSHQFGWMSSHIASLPGPRSLNYSTVIATVRASRHCPPDNERKFTVVLA